MSEEYIFEYPGTKQMFIDSLKQFPNNDNNFYYFDDYIVKLTENEIHFGVERAGHSGGYWFIPQIVEYENKTEFRGEIQFIGPVDKKSKIRKKTGNFLGWLALILISVIILPLILYISIKDIILKREKQNIETTDDKREDKLFDLLENYLGCKRKST